MDRNIKDIAGLETRQAPHSTITGLQIIGQCQPGNFESPGAQVWRIFGVYNAGLTTSVDQVAYGRKSTGTGASFDFDSAWSARESAITWTHITT